MNIDFLKLDKKKVALFHHMIFQLRILIILPKKTTEILKINKIDYE